MEYVGNISQDGDLVNKKYVDGQGILVTISVNDYEALSAEEKNNPNKYYFITDNPS